MAQALSTFAIIGGMFCIVATLLRTHPPRYVLMVALGVVVLVAVLLVVLPYVPPREPDA